MSSSSFYKSVIEEELKAFNINKFSFENALRNVVRAYNEKSLALGHTFIDYNQPENRCAYLHKYAALHTDLVKKYFLRFLKKRTRKILNCRKNLRICCLGGGPGTDIVGIFKALALIPHYHKKVIKVVILDICNGWSNSFKIILSKLMEGKMENIPPEFFDVSKFEAELIEVNLLETLPVNVVETISTADIISSVKFISAVLGNAASTNAIKFIAGAFKVDSLFLFIDNMKRNVYKLVEGIAAPTGLEIVLGPIHQNFSNVSAKRKNNVTAKYLPTIGTHVSVVGMLKTMANTNSNSQVLEDLASISIASGCDSWETESDIISANNVAEHINDLSDDEEKSDTISKLHQFTQTNVDWNNSFKNFDNVSDSSEKNLELLIEALDKLLVTFDKFTQFSNEKQCFNCHCLRNGCI